MVRAGWGDELKDLFNLMDYSELKYYFFLSFERENNVEFLKQAAYWKIFLEQYGMDLAKSATTLLIEHLESQIFWGG